MDLAKRLSRIEPSATMAVTQRAGELRAEGVDVISLSAGEPDFDMPAHIVDAARRALDGGETRYTPVAGVPALREAVAAESARVRGVPCDPEGTIITAGAKQALYGFFAAVLDPGDEVIIPAPYWVSYPDQVRLVDGAPVIAETRAEDGFVLTPAALERALTPRSRVLVLNTPCNPTGAVYPGSAVRAVTALAVEAGLYVLSDEIYRDLIYGGAAHASPLSAVPEDKRDRVFVVDGVSKTYAMTGLRVGWGIGDPQIVEGMSVIQGQSTSNPSSLGQAAALAAVTGSREFLPGWIEQYVARRDALVAGLDALDGVSCLEPGGAFYALPSFRGVLDRMGGEADDVKLATWLLEEARVAGVPGSAFGAPGHLRFSYATSLEMIEKALGRLAVALEAI